MSHAHLTRARAPVIEPTEAEKAENDMELIARGDKRFRGIREAIEKLDMKEQCSFGERARLNLFQMVTSTVEEKKYWFTNHGSFGAVPWPVWDAHSLLLSRVEEHPDSWFRRDVKTLYSAACDAAAKFVGAKSEEVVLVDNATTAVNTVLRSLRLGEKDGVMVTSFSYNACSVAARAACESSGAKLHVMEINLPITSCDSIVQQYRDFLDQHPDVTFSLVDHITSPAAVVMPVREIVRVCRERGVRVMVDAAHSPGQLPLDVKDLGAEFLTGNFHKWVFCTRGSALLYVQDGLQDSIFPLVASHFHYHTLRERFTGQATRDMVSFCVTPTAICFFEKIGGLEAVTEYNTSLISWATDMLCEHLSLSPLPVPPEMRAPFMSLVVLPSCLGPATPDNELRLVEKIFHKYGVQTVICVVDGRLCCRISTQIYNVREDYEKLADALKNEIDQANS